MSTTEELTPERVAQMLHVAVERVTEAIQRGDLPADCVDGRYRISGEQLEAFTRHGHPFRQQSAVVSDEALMARAQGGESAAFDELVRRYRGRIWALCQFSLRDRSEADDLTQETLVKVFHRRDQYDPSQPVGPWIMEIAKNTVLDRIRKRDWRLRSEQAGPREEEEGERNLDDTIASQEPDPQLQIEMRELWHAVDGCLERLSPRLRLAVWSRFFEEHSYRGMMDALEVTSPRGAQGVVDRALQQLRNCLAGKGYEAA